MAMPHESTPALNTLIKAEPDLVDRIFDYLIAEVPALAHHLDTPDRLTQAKRAVRLEFQGQREYIPARSSLEQRDLADQVLRLFNGRNAREVARRLGIGRATVYRYIKQAGVPADKNRLTFAVNETAPRVRSQAAPPRRRTTDRQD